MAGGSAQNDKPEPGLGHKSFKKYELNERDEKSVRLTPGGTASAQDYRLARCPRKANVRIYFSYNILFQPLSGFSAY